MDDGVIHRVYVMYRGKRDFQVMGKFSVVHEEKLVLSKLCNYCPLLARLQTSKESGWRTSLYKNYITEVIK